MTPETVPVPKSTLRQFAQAMEGYNAMKLNSISFVSPVRELLHYVEHALDPDAELITEMAQAMRAVDRNPLGGATWDELTNEEQTRLRTQAKAALDAARARQALQEAQEGR